MKELARVRLVARLAATGLGVLVGLAALGGRVSDTRLGATAPAISVEILAQPGSATRPRPAPSGSRAPHGAGRTETALPLLWRYSSDGAIVFARTEQYRRCLAARRQRREEADCPSANETRALTLSQSPEETFAGLSFTEF